MDDIDIFTRIRRIVRLTPAASQARAVVRAGLTDYGSQQKQDSREEIL